MCLAQTLNHFIYNFLFGTLGRWIVGPILCFCVPFLFLIFGGKCKLWDHFFKDEPVDQFVALYLHVKLGVGSIFSKDELVDR